MGIYGVELVFYFCAYFEWIFWAQSEGLAQQVALALNGRLCLGKARFGLQELYLKTQCLYFGDETHFKLALASLQIGARKIEALFLDLELAQSLHQGVVVVNYLSFKLKALLLKVEVCVGKVVLGALQADLFGGSVEYVVLVIETHVAREVEKVIASVRRKITSLTAGCELNGANVGQPPAHTQIAIIGEVGALIAHAGRQGDALLRIAHLCEGGCREVGVHVESERGLR